MKVKPQIKGLDKVLRKLTAFGEDGKKRIAKVTADAALDIQHEATQNAPKMYKYADGEEEHVNGEISQSIFSEKITDTYWTVTVNSTMGAYAEFGTGAYVEVSPEFKDIAWSYYVNGKGLMLPQPYFYPAWIKGKKQYMKDLKDALHGLQQKY
ncbi:HK97-gp10 family putative phage morphogenesis protein [Elizabethkingia anophelis]|uniref:HK97-gp10 family putative phage morphogenesis protein n=1 Tax=Elizabethkingia anophelis TaxID=1117645 RepID=UPI001625A512|nr:HK97-gp10 family putative phage morphogenesis protein [Elizabethkingia anophelis]